MAKFVETFNLHWHKIVLLVLFNLRSTAFCKYRLSPFEIIIGRPMRLHQGMYEPALPKGDFFYHKELTGDLKTNSWLIEQSFHCVLPVDLQQYALQPRNYVYWKCHLHKDALHPWWKGPAISGIIS